MYICKTCHSNGKEVVVTPKLTSSTDISWFGLAKYAWSGYVLHCMCCEWFASGTLCKEDYGTIRIIKTNLHFILILNMNQLRHSSGLLVEHCHLQDTCSNWD
jgi:hypothetical protein